jgi:hypothetical protein
LRRVGGEIARPSAPFQRRVREVDDDGERAGANQRRVDANGDRRVKVLVVADASFDRNGFAVEFERRRVQTGPKVEVAANGEERFRELSEFCRTQGLSVVRADRAD